MLQGKLKLSAISQYKLKAMSKEQKYKSSTTPMLNCLDTKNNKFDPSLRKPLLKLANTQDGTKIEL